MMSKGLAGKAGARNGLGQTELAVVIGAIVVVVFAAVVQVGWRASEELTATAVGVGDPSQLPSSPRVGGSGPEAEAPAGGANEPAPGNATSEGDAGDAGGNAGGKPGNTGSQTGGGTTPATTNSNGGGAGNSNTGGGNGNTGGAGNPNAGGGNGNAGGAGNSNAGGGNGRGGGAGNPNAGGGGNNAGGNAGGGIARRILGWLFGW